MAQSNETLTDVAEKIGSTLGAVVGGAEAMKDRIVSAVEDVRTPSLTKVRKSARRRMWTAGKRVRRAAGTIRTKARLAARRTADSAEKSAKRRAKQMAGRASRATAAARRAVRTTRSRMRARKGSTARRRK